MTVEQAKREARALAKSAHGGQMDKGGNPYVESHLDVVAGFAETPLEALVAYLHDVAEDTPMTESQCVSMLHIGDGNRALLECILMVLNHNRYSSRQEYLDAVKKNTVARRVKCYDLCSNLDISRIPAPTERDFERVKRYEKEIRELLACEDDRHFHDKIERELRRLGVDIP